MTMPTIENKIHQTSSSNCSRIVVVVVDYIFYIFEFEDQKSVNYQNGAQMNILHEGTEARSSNYLEKEKLKRQALDLAGRSGEGIIFIFYKFQLLLKL